MGCRFSNHADDSNLQRVEKTQKSALLPNKQSDPCTDCCSGEEEERRMTDAYFLAEMKEMNRALSKMKEDRLRTMDVFVIDNSVRETTVAEIRGHVAEDKDKILEQISKTGIKDVIVGAFGNYERVEDVWLEDKRASGGINKNWWCFSELYDRPVRPNHTPFPHGLRCIKAYGIKNVILEMDVTCRFISNFTVEDYRSLLKSRVDFIRGSVHPDAKIFLNIRDAPTAFSNATDPRNFPGKLNKVLRAISALRPRIHGILFEDPKVDNTHWALGDVSAYIRSTMDAVGWSDGHLLVHVHKKYGLSDAAVLECLAMGCTGIWCAVCEEGGGLGHACSLTTLVNLARLGNKKVAKQYNLGNMHHAAVEITQISTGRLPPPRTEVYGVRALDVVFGDGGMGAGSSKQVSDIICRRSLVTPRISPFADEQMVAQKLTQYFGRRRQDWSPSVIEMMIGVIHSDLVGSRSWQYSGAAGLLDLYTRSGGKDYIQDMQDSLMATYFAMEKAHPLIKELKEEFDEAKTRRIAKVVPSCSLGPVEVVREEPEEVEAPSSTATTSSPSINLRRVKLLARELNRVIDKNRPGLGRTATSAELLRHAGVSLTYSEFAHGFLGPYCNVTGNPVEDPTAMAIIQFIDTDGSGEVEWREMCSRALWVLETFEDEVDAYWTLRDLLDRIFHLCQADAEATADRKDLLQDVPDLLERLNIASSQGTYGLRHSRLPSVPSQRDAIAFVHKITAI